MLLEGPSEIDFNFIQDQYTDQGIDQEEDDRLNKFNCSDDVLDDPKQHQNNAKDSELRP